MPKSQVAEPVINYLNNFKLLHTQPLCLQTIFSKFLLEQSSVFKSVSNIWRLPDISRLLPS